VAITNESLNLPARSGLAQGSPGPPGTTSVGLQQALSGVAQWTRFPSSALESDWPQDFGAFTAYDWWWVALLASLGVIAGAGLLPLELAASLQP
jgi:hypothetical protein